MNTAHWHLVLNHIPIIGIVIGTLSLITGFIFSSDSIKRLSMGILVVSGLFAIPAYFTGEGAEDLVENLPGVAESNIENHESSGLAFLILATTVGLLGAITFILDWMNNRVSRLLYIVVLVVSIGASIFGKIVGTSGGEIRHTEIRSGNNAPSVNNANDNEGSEKEKD